MERQSVSICMATYNGIKYIRNQIDSILPQLKENDELIISDDGSTDGTLEYIIQLSEKDHRIKVVDGPHKGANANFFSLINLAVNDILFFSDQDDIWFLNKIDKVCKAFEENKYAKVVLHEDTIYYKNENKEVNCNKLKHGIIRNLIKSSYSGHRMAFRKEFKAKIMAKTTACPAYDMYLGLLAEKNKCCYFLHEKLDRHIMRGNNQTKKLSISEKILIRWKLFLCLCHS